ncbi:LAMI_0H03752g1_1 [Lachancea mirantina]|uniref:LAMI_0H03752g1_1 n=1 Tax=Lachancea mirantina TaxID=1230905 RepID=A0A1G4KEE2_9SACH|nr:LAMI_0H03752g1_1 [Lachancea mirantina]
MSSLKDVVASFKRKKADLRLIDFVNFKFQCQNDVLAIQNVRDEKLARFLQITQQLKQTYATEGTYSEALFELSNEQLKALNRIADGEEAWITDVLQSCARQLLKVGQELDRRAKEESITANKKKKVKGDLEEETFLEKCVRTIHTSFKLCLNDRNPDFQRNKKWGVYYFINIEFKIYQQLGNRDMVRNLVKVIASRVSELPAPEKALRSHRSQLITYLYYLGEHYGCHEGDYRRGFEYLQRAWLGCPANASQMSRQTDKIVALLVPFALLASHWYPDMSALAQYHPRVALLYAPLIKSVLNGDLREFDKWLAANEMFLMRRNLYVATVLIRQLVLLKLIKTTRAGFKDPAASVVPLASFVAAIRYSAKHSHVTHITDDDHDETECLLADLIARGYVRGYLSHANRVIVLSKSNPFPKLVSSPQSQL